uniref:RING-type E3 ubiquitin transferase n=1 Tax=Panagrolaimus sp. JU765 TaxID=591449 RepID=A0AC34QDH9_9BILA
MEGNGTAQPASNQKKTPNPKPTRQNQNGNQQQQQGHQEKKAPRNAEENGTASGGQSATSRRGRGNYNMRGNHRSDYGKKVKSAQDFNKMIKSRKDHGGVGMTGNVSDCLICCQPSDIFGIGPCQHPVCMECCIRMRILGDSKSCPQCRSPIENLTFVSAPVDWDNFKIPTKFISHKHSERHGINFSDKHTVDAYEGYMAHVCNVCLAKGDRLEFPTFGALRHHMSNTHNRLFCTICFEHLNILSKDRLTYSQEELKLHTEGRTNEVMGQKGHPKCMFCEKKFFDNDFLYRHLRQDHFFCQICESDGETNVFYRKIEELYAHYRKKHHPCMDPECQGLGIVFKTDVELGVHRAAEHGGGARNVNIDFQFSGRNLGNRILRSGVADNRTRNADPEPPPTTAPPPPPPVNTVIVPSAQLRQRVVIPSKTRTVIVPSASGSQQTKPQSAHSKASRPVEEFPSLGTSAANSSAISNSTSNWRQEVQVMRNADLPAAPAPPVRVTSAEQFPSLSSANPISGNSALNFSSIGSANKKKKQGNTVWSKGNPTALFTDESQNVQPKPRPPEQSRRHILPAPDIWPEGMRERVEAKMKGLPDPGNSQQVPLDPLFRVEAAKRAKNAQRKVKAKSIAAGTVLQENNEGISTTQSKFSALKEIDEASSSKKNQNKESLSRTVDNFVRIESTPTLRSVAASIGSKSTPKAPENSKEDKQKPSNSGSTALDAMQNMSNDNLGSNLPSLLDIVSGRWSIGQNSPQSNPDNNQKKENSWSTAPPPGFS